MTVISIVLCIGFVPSAIVLFVIAMMTTPIFRSDGDQIRGSIALAGWLLLFIPAGLSWADLMVAFGHLPEMEPGARFIFLLFSLPLMLWAIAWAARQYYKTPWSTQIDLAFFALFSDGRHVVSHRTRKLQLMGLALAGMHQVVFLMIVRLAALI